MLSQLLASVAGARAFIVCRIEPIPGKTKTNKLPVDSSGRLIDAQDPSQWLTLTDAEQCAQHLAQTQPCPLGYGVGVVLHESLGIGCIDIDGAAQLDGSWSPLAHDLCSRFPGAYVEVSTSGTGLHIFFRCAYIPDHRTRKKGLALEVYTRKRFILLTGKSACGDLNIDHTAALKQVIHDYLPEPVISVGTEWTTTPTPGWRGIGMTDEQIIAELRNDMRLRTVMGGQCPFAALFDGDVEALARYYPGDNGGGFNASSADQALANYFAPRTGYNCEHILRLMWLSALVRDKWERDDYMRRTILSAVAGKTVQEQHDADEQEPAPPSMMLATPPVPAPAPPLPAAPSAYLTPGLGTAQELTAYLNADRPPPVMVADTVVLPPSSVPYRPAGDMLNMWADYIHIEDVGAILTPHGTLLARPQFDVRFGGYDYQMRSDGTKPTGSAWEAFTQNQVVRMPRAHGMTFDPTREPRALIARDNMVYINSWVPVPIEMREGDVTPFLTHLYKLFPYGRDGEILLAYFAFLMQHKGVKAQWCPFLQGVEGNGKTFFSVLLEHCLGARYTHWAKAAQLDSRFNASFYGKLLVCVEDAQVTEAKADVWESLKPMITNKRLEIEAKGVEKVTRDVCFNFIINSNHKDGIRKTKNDRRIAPFFGAQQHEHDLIRSGLTPRYFVDLYNWARDGGFAYVAHFLAHYPIPDELNPARDCVRAPLTSSTDQAVTAGRGSIEQEVIEAVEEGREGFRGGWINSMKFDQLLREIGKARFLPRNKRGELLEAIGYMKHPELPDGRCIRALPDGSRPVLYIKKLGHPHEKTGENMLDVPKYYLEAQKP